MEYNNYMGNCCYKKGLKHKQTSGEIGQIHDEPSIKLPTDDYISSLTGDSVSFYISQDSTISQYCDFELVKSWSASETIRHISVGEVLLCSGREIESFSLDGEALFKLSGHEKFINSVIQKSNLAVSGGRDYTTRTWDLEKQKEIDRNLINWNVVTSMCWLPSSDVFVQTSEDLNLRLWDARQSLKRESLVASVGNYFATSVDVADMIATGHRGFDGSGCDVKIWDVRKAEETACMSQHSQAVTGVSCTQTGVLSCAKDATILKSTWNGEVQEEWKEETNHPILCVTQFYDGLLAATSEPRVLFLTINPLSLKL